jgi:hypothetical protein
VAAERNQADAYGIALGGCTPAPHQRWEATLRLAAPLSAEPVTLLQYLFAASRGRRWIGRSQITLAGEEPWADIQSY